MSTSPASLEQSSAYQPSSAKFYGNTQGESDNFSGPVTCARATIQQESKRLTATITTRSWWLFNKLLPNIYFGSTPPPRVPVTNEGLGRYAPSLKMEVVILVVTVASWVGGVDLKKIPFNNRWRNWVHLNERLHCTKTCTPRQEPLFC